MAEDFFKEGFNAGTMIQFLEQYALKARDAGGWHLHHERDMIRRIIIFYCGSQTINTPQKIISTLEIIRKIIEEVLNNITLTDDLKYSALRALYAEQSRLSIDLTERKIASGDNEVKNKFRAFLIQLMPPGTNFDGQFLDYLSNTNIGVVRKWTECEANSLLLGDLETLFNQQRFKRTKVATREDDAL